MKRLLACLLVAPLAACGGPPQAIEAVSVLDGAPSSVDADADSGADAKAATARDAGTLLAGSTAVLHDRGIIGTAGGTVVASDEVWLVVPPNALDGDVMIEIAELRDPAAGSVGRAWEIGPSGTAFRLPAQVTIKPSALTLAGRALADLAVSTYAAGRWQPTDMPTIDAARSTVTGNVWHLSPYALVPLHASPMAAADGGAPFQCPAGACANGICQNGSDDYTCRCDSDYRFDPIKKLCVQQDDCPAAACGGGVCLDLDRDWVCACDSGYTGTGTKSCSDNDECKVGSVVCAIGSHCVNDPGAYHCACEAGLVIGPAGTCVASDGCADVACAASSHCAAGACVCDAGFVAGPSNNCVASDPCLGKQCGFRGTCQSGACVCAQGAVLDTSTHACVDANECDTPRICGDGGQCTNQAGSYRCDYPQSPKRQACILPLGDSITASDATHLGYRYWLWDALVSAGYSFDFVGTAHGNQGGDPSYPKPDFDRDHEGHGGYRADMIRDNLAGYVAQYSVGLALVHLGTNDVVYQGESPDGTAAEIGEIIDLLRAKNPRIAIVLAQIIPTTMASNQQATILNGLLASLASERNSTASPIVLVDQNTGFDPQTDTVEGVHPNESGERKMAKRWLDALAPLLDDTVPCQ